MIQSPICGFFCTGDSGCGVHFADTDNRFDPFSPVLTENGARIHRAESGLPGHTGEELSGHLSKTATQTPLAVVTPCTGRTSGYRSPP